jgi:hypothetical protein
MKKSSNPATSRIPTTDLPRLILSAPSKERTIPMSFSRRLARLGLFSAALLLGTFVLSASTARTAHAAPLTCDQVRNSVITLGEVIRQKLDEEAAGFEYRISSRKRLVVHSVASVSNGQGDCEIEVVANVTLKRKLRRDAHGTMTLRGRVDVDAVEPRTFDLFFSDIYVSDVSLSHTLDIGEAIYAWVANIILPDSRSLRISF